MSKNYRRFNPVTAIRNIDSAFDGKKMNITRIFGENTLQLETLKRAFTKRLYGRSLKKTITDSEPLNSDVADAVAVVMKDWAMERGATHFTHWFQPLTGYTAEKAWTVLSLPTRAVVPLQNFLARN